MGAVTPDGRFIVFVSKATNLVAGDTNGAWDVFVRDRTSGITERVSVSTGGAEGNADSAFCQPNIGTAPDISDDGRYVTFVSMATNLVPGDGNGVADVFVRDRLAGTTTRVSVSTGGAEANGLSWRSNISGDGRIVAFAADATNLTADDGDTITDTYVRDLVAGTTELVSKSTLGVKGNNRSLPDDISADGRIVLFGSHATNLVPGGTNGHLQLFARDRVAKATELVSSDAAGVQGNYVSMWGRISADGRYVVFDSGSTNLVTPDTNSTTADVYLKDRNTGAIERVSLTSSGTQPNDHSQIASLSDDGRIVAWQSPATDVVPNDTNGVNDVFRRDRLTGITERITETTTGEANGTSGSVRLAADGDLIAFSSLATNLVAGDTNGVADLFVWVPIGPPASVTLTPGAATNQVGTSHTVTATVEDSSGNPVAGVTLRSAVTGSVSQTNSCITNTNGQCTFTYTGPNLPGTDLIHAFADTDGDGTEGSDEPFGVATKDWALPPSTAGHVTGGGQAPNAMATDQVTFSFNAKSDASGVKGTCTVVDKAAGIKVKSTKVTAVVQSGNSATIFGEAMVDGATTAFRIDVEDNAEPGKGNDIFMIQTGSGYSAGGTLTQGNVQVH
jgi:Bacterial Ig-like domain (group 1)